ncbi:MAG TPA: hypothetical protein DCQ64_19930 [Candidatus Rokubacteria bacterium]|nr:hypothetical protein [Candidatus Rokubacteria bacterium]
MLTRLAFRLAALVLCAGALLFVGVGATTADRAVSGWCGLVALGFFILGVSAWREPGRLLASTPLDRSPR